MNSASASLDPAILASSQHCQSMSRVQVSGLNMAVQCRHRIEALSKSLSGVPSCGSGDPPRPLVLPPQRGGTRIRLPVASSPRSRPPTGPSEFGERGLLLGIRPFEAARHGPPQEHCQSGDAKSFAEQTIKDHTKAGNDFKSTVVFASSLDWILPGAGGLSGERAGPRAPSAEPAVGSDATFAVA
jgi:hypothetical protein